MNTTSCRNLNHCRSNAPVRFCPQCGEVVGGGVAIKRCDEMGHAEKRRNGERFCVDCGERLIK
jgi:ribosomal protein S27AE